MVTSQKTLEKIHQAIKSHYAMLSLRVIGGIKGFEHLLRLVYYHTFATPPDHKNPPKTIKNVRVNIKPLTMFPKASVVKYTVEASDDHQRVLIDQIRANTTASIDNLIRANNDDYKRNAIQNLKRGISGDVKIKKTSLKKLKIQIGKTKEKATSEFRRISVTEISNLVGSASVDRIIDNHSLEEDEVNTSEIFVFRIPVNDNATCRWCKKFYMQPGETPKIYRLSTLLANGSNYGKHTSAWLPVVSNTHPNTRTSQIIELPPRFIVLPGGRLTFVGHDKAKQWLDEHLIA